MDMRNLHNQASPVTSSPGLDISGTIDPRIHDALQHNKSSSGLNADGFPSPSIDIPTPMDGLMQMNNEMVANDAYAWAEAGLAPFDNLFFGTSFTFDHNDLSMPSLGSISDISTASEPMMASSSRGSIDRTNDTSMAASLNNDPGPYKMIDMSLIVEAENSVAEFSAVIAAEAAWPMARCSQPMYSGRCPRTAIVHLEALESKSREEGTWTALQSYLNRAALDGDSNALPQVKPLSANSREQMLAITQSFLHKALEIHRGGFSMYAKTNLMQHGRFPFNFIVLPPSNIVEYFLGSYVRSLTVYFSLVQCHIIDPNEMLYNTQASTLLVLLMIAQGAAAVPMAEARFLSGGLIETCRISLFDIIERDVELSADPIVLRCALLFTLLGAWSGDAWLMNIAMGQRGMYLSMLKHAGMLDQQPSMIPTLSTATSPSLQWRSWLQRESRNRLVYNFVMIDQELSLFHDCSPILSIAELQCPLPGPEALWQSPDAESWYTSAQHLYGCTANVNPQLLSSNSLTPSLYDIFQDFLHDNLTQRRYNFSPQHLRLLLHPLQSLLFHLRQVLSCFSDVYGVRRSPTRTICKTSTATRLDEVQELLEKWYELCMELHASNPECEVTRCNLVLYHLVSLNRVAHFPEIERLARREAFDGTPWELSLRHKRCISHREEAIFHCGQVIRLIEAMPVDRRPPWWAAALYRATLILWTDSLVRADPSFKGAANSGNGPGMIIINRVLPEDPNGIPYMWGEYPSTIVLSCRDGSTVSLDRPTEVLAFGVDILKQSASTRFVDGLKRKLVALAETWELPSYGVAFPP
ncbi:uncharacterized protein E0L32_000065 [Thyridium curvatum]|uniref:Xylanolytic transcriptional activator regulatory domain-containing protein n=1 Tax=Thyridium curvatum TaxID=1093900 RepID=A0A507BFI8_9PEZI|nr:uncharacterized protein E0L32_000065 [Thyridium curvatum]TPX15731.1 hypothetical protein E0L32_000065 [Thyridium curvatum]